MNKETRIWLLFYTHRHGHDHAMYTTKEECLRHAEFIVAENREHWEVEESISNRGAISMWPELTDGDENIEYGDYPLFERFEP